MKSIKIKLTIILIFCLATTSIIFVVNKTNAISNVNDSKMPYLISYNFTTRYDIKYGHIKIPVV